MFSTPQTYHALSLPSPPLKSNGALTLLQTWFKACRSLGLLGLLLLITLKSASASSVPVSVYGYGPEPVAPGETAVAYLSASIDGDPNGYEECTLNNESWSWSVSSLKHSTNGGQTWTDVAGPYTMVTFDPTNQPYTDMSVVLSSPGKWKFKVNASVSYKSNCGDGSGSGSTDITVTVGAGPKNWKPTADNSPSNIGHYSYQDEDGSTVEGEDGRMIQPVDQTLSGSPTPTPTPGGTPTPTASPTPTPTPGTVTVKAGQPLECEVEWATDQDQWSMVMGDGTTKTGWDEEETEYKWTAEGGSGSGQAGSLEDATSPYTTWTAPLEPGTYTLKCTINDPWTPDEGAGKPTGVTAPETGDRNDAPLVRTVQVIVLPPSKRWSSSPAIAGTITTSTGDTQVYPGSGLTLQISGVVDVDSWQQGSQSGQENDSVTSYRWSGPGTFGSPDSASTTWTAPIDAGPKTYILTCTLDDAAADVPADEEGTRDDIPTPITITITVPSACQVTLSSQELKWNSVLMSWTQCSDDDFVSYKLYRSTSSATFIPGDSTSTYLNRYGDETKVSKTNYLDSGLSPQTTYHYALVTSHGGTSTISRKSITTPEKPPFEVKFENQLARACAGGIGVDGVHDFTITGEAKNPDGTLVTGTALEFSFENNKGHNYGEGIEQKKAKFVVPKASGGYDFLETMTATTDQYGKVSVRVLSSDIVSKDIEIKVKWKNQQNQMKEVGNKACDFAEAIAKRRFPNTQDPTEAYPADDSGWLFGQKYLVAPGNETTAKMYLKFQKNPENGDQNGNWSFVNGHQMLFEVEDIDTKEGETASNKSDYVTFVGASPDGTVTQSTVNDGAATATLRGNTKIAEAQTITLSVYDQSQWQD